MEKKIKFNLSFFLKCGLLLLTLAYYVFLFFGASIFGADTLFYRSFDIFSGAGDPNKIIRIASYTIFFLSISFIIRFILTKLTNVLKNGRALMQIFCSLIKYAAVIALIFYILKTLGVDTTAILAGIGILGLIVGLGAQPLIADIIAGMFIVFEHVFEIGDIIVVDGFRGTVKEIGIRTTRIEDVSGNIKVINNADIKTLINMTDKLSIAYCDLSIEYGESLERVESILSQNLDLVKQNIPEIVEGPFYKGVSELADSAVVIRFTATCDESVRYQVERDLNRQFKLLFDKYNINIPFPQIVINQPTQFEKVNSSQKKEAQKFVEEQKEISKNIPAADENASEN